MARKAKAVMQEEENLAHKVFTSREEALAEEKKYHVAGRKDYKVHVIFLNVNELGIAVQKPSGEKGRIPKKIVRFTVSQNSSQACYSVIRSIGSVRVATEADDKREIAATMTPEEHIALLRETYPDADLRKLAAVGS